MNDRLFPGDVVEVKTPDEILQTLDSDGTLDHLPFMPEMIDSCGKRFRVSRRVLKTCMSGSGPSTMRGLKVDDVVTLDGLRCSGTAHDGCQKECTILWRQAWLRKAKNAGPASSWTPEAGTRLRARLKTVAGAKRYFCQASELLRFTDALPRSERFRPCANDIRSGNCGVLEMGRRIAIWSYWRARRVVFGEYARGSNKKTPAESLKLSRGESVQVKTIQEIVDTTDHHAKNRGLFFSPDMRLLCGQEAQVRTHLDKIIVDGTGEMRQLKDTVYLEGSMCGCAHAAFGGCPRGEFAYWREIWLRRQTG